MELKLYKNFSLEVFKEDLTENLFSDCNSYDDFDHIFTSQLDKHAPKKKKWIRDNNKSHVNKGLRSTIMTTSKLKNRADKTKSLHCIINYI